MRSTRDVANISVLAPLSALGLEVRSTRRNTIENKIEIGIGKVPLARRLVS